MPHTGIHPYTAPSWQGNDTTIGRSRFGPQDGTLLLSIEGDQNPAEDCHSATNFQAQVVLLPTGRVSLYWSDQVVNEWSEEYARLSDAMLRLAGIVRAYEGDFAHHFTAADVETFVRRDAPAAFGQILA